MCKEYGGFLPFDLNCNTKDFFEEYEGILVKVNSGRTAICYGISELNPKRVFVPFYCCPDVKSSILKLGYEVIYYKLDYNMMPIIDDYNEQQDALIWTNYFGMMGFDKINNILEKYSNIVIDNAQAFFNKPIIKNKVYNAYSCRKFLGVPDGGYIIGRDIKKRELKNDISWYKMSFLFKQIELGTNASYKDYLYNEGLLEDSFLSMSKLTSILMKTFDYEHIKIKRRNNFNILKEELKEYNTLNFVSDNDVSPYIYPLIIKENNIREYLLSKKLYVPTWWKHINQLQLGLNAIEIKLSNNLIPLPIDQRYNESDMHELANIVKGFYKNDK